MNLACVAGGISLAGVLAAEPLAPRGLLVVCGFLPSRLRNIPPATQARMD